MKTILVLMADQEFRNRLNPRLEERGWRVVEATDPKLAPQLAAECRPAVV